MRVIYFIVFLLTLLSCKKDPGIGGLNTVNGVVNAIYVQEGSFDTLEIGPLPETRVYIVYGEGTTHDDDMRTSANGSYKFEHLHPGNYQIYTYSENLLSPSGNEAIWQSVELDKGRNTKKIPDFTVIKYVKP